MFRKPIKEFSFNFKIMINVLYIHSSSVYYNYPNLGCWSEKEDARNFTGKGVIIAHPPCRLWSQMRAFSKAECARYQYHEFMLELLTIFIHGGISHKRDKLDSLMRSDTRASEIARAEMKVTRCLKWLRSILGDEGLRRSRFSKKADLYSVFGVLAELMDLRTVTTNRMANRAARRALMSLNLQIAKIDPKVVRYSIGKGIHAGKQLASYVIATREGTDQLVNRERRHELLKGILFPIFTKRLARRRLFPSGHKGALWLASQPKHGRITCPNPLKNTNCLGRMTYEQCEVDHRLAYAKGGRTELRNAQLLCRVCNASKGAK